MMTTLRKHGYRVALGSLFPHDPFFVDQGPLIAKYLLARVSCFLVCRKALPHLSGHVADDKGPQAAKYVFSQW